jgi:hypothetical protein
MNARALKARIRARVIDHKFECQKLERVYRHQVLRESLALCYCQDICLTVYVFPGEKDQAQSKVLIRRTCKGVSSLVSRFNKIVQEMQALRNSGQAPPGARLPRRLQMKKLFRLDVDDKVWDDDGLGGLDGNKLAPRWLSDDNVHKGIVALLDHDRCAEEEERLVIEAKAMQKWLREKVMDVQTALVTKQGNLSL